MNEEMKRKRCSPSAWWFEAVAPASPRVRRFGVVDNLLLEDNKHDKDVDQEDEDYQDRDGHYGDDYQSLLVARPGRCCAGGASARGGHLRHPRHLGHLRHFEGGCLPSLGLRWLALKVYLFPNPSEASRLLLPPWRSLVRPPDVDVRWRCGIPLVGAGSGGILAQGPFGNRSLDPRKALDQSRRLDHGTVGAGARIGSSRQRAFPFLFLYFSRKVGQNVVCDEQAPRVEEDENELLNIIVIISIITSSIILILGYPLQFS